MVPSLWLEIRSRFRVINSCCHACQSRSDGLLKDAKEELHVEAAAALAGLSMLAYALARIKDWEDRAGQIDVRLRSSSL